MLKLSKKADPMSEHKIYKPKPISGFPEWLPEYRIIEQQWMDKIRAVFESYGFCNIETSSAEEIEVLTAKGGETENEIYTLTRLQADENDKKDARLALRYDLTVPMARYVAQNFGQLVFPFKRYQMQKSWRGERPQKGRYREFYQCDIDVVGVDDLPLHFDAELPAVLYQAYEALDIPPVTIHISNRKIVVGYLLGLGITDTAFVTRTLDKIDKIRRDGALKILTEGGMAADLANKCLAIVDIRSSDASFADKVRALGVTHDQLTEGLDELTFVMNNLQHLPQGAVLADLGIIRGLDYYTGTVLEVQFRDSKGLSIGGGGRYENLASSFINQKLPGIGVSIGLTRLFGLLMDDGKIKPGKKTPAEILVALPDESRRAEAAATAHVLRQRGYKVEMYHRDAKIKNQMAYAEKKGINYVWFPPFKEGQPHEVKDMATGEQKPADPQNWKM
jgi:histidyl-tRNA synthetase